MSIGLWRLGLKRSFPDDGELLFERFMLGLYERARTAKEREQANAFDRFSCGPTSTSSRTGDTDLRR